MSAWRAAYGAHVETCEAAFRWMGEPDTTVTPGAEPIRRCAASWDALRPLLKHKRGPRLVAEAYDATLRHVAEGFARYGTVAPSQIELLDEYLTLMNVYARFRPSVAAPIVLVPTVVPGLVLMGYLESWRAGLGALPDSVYLAVVIAAVVVNAGFVYAIVQRIADRAHLYGPYAIWAVPPALGSFVVLFALAYWIPAPAADSCMNKALTRVDALYFSLTTFTTTGFGDLHAVTPLCRGLVSLQMAVTFVLVVLGVSLLVSRASAARPVL